MSGNPRHKVRLMAAALCAVALVAAGCGGSEYQKKYDAASQQFKKSSQAAATKMRSSKSAGQYIKAASQFEASIKTFVAKLQKLKPPSDAKAAHARLVKALDALADDLGGIAKARKKGDVQKLNQLNGKIVSDIGAMQAAGKALDDAVD